MGYSVFNTGFGQEASYPMDIFIFISLEKNHSIYLRMFEQDLYVIVSVIKWLSAAGMPAMRRGILYIPPKGVRGNLWHIPVQSPNSKTASSCWTRQDLKANYKVEGEHGCVLLWLCCSAQRTASFPPDFFFSSLLVFLSFVCFLTSGIWGLLVPGKLRD